MKHQFLCPNHREELTNKPIQALRSWANTNETGIVLAGVGQHYDALPHLGCAFEVAEIILTGHFVEQEKAISLLTKSALILADSLRVLGYEEQRVSVLQLTLNRLDKVSNAAVLFSDQMNTLGAALGSTLEVSNTLH
jgi:coenzyme F420-reducing hydrogenase delta subunit